MLETVKNVNPGSERQNQAVLRRRAVTDDRQWKPHAQEAAVNVKINQCCGKRGGGSS
jgi:hypothetical protein